MSCNLETAEKYKTALFSLSGVSVFCSTDENVWLLLPFMGKGLLDFMNSIRLEQRL